MNCPACDQPLAHVAGTSLDQHLPEAKRDGFTVYCPHRNCPAEIQGHGGTVKEAEKIVSQRKLKSEANENYE